MNILIKGLLIATVACLLGRPPKVAMEGQLWSEDEDTVNYSHVMSGRMWSGDGGHHSANTSSKGVLHKCVPSNTILLADAWKFNVAVFLLLAADVLKKMAKSLVFLAFIIFWHEHNEIAITTLLIVAGILNIVSRSCVAIVVLGNYIVH